MIQLLDGCVSESMADCSESQQLLTLSTYVIPYLNTEQLMYTLLQLNMMNVFVSFDVIFCVTD